LDLTIYQRRQCNLVEGDGLLTAAAASGVGIGMVT
jgi:hypothetical protein